MSAVIEVELLPKKGVMRCTLPMAPFPWLPWLVIAMIKRIHSIKGVICMKRDGRSHVKAVLSSCHDRRGDGEVYILIIKCLIASSSQTSEAHCFSKQSAEV